MKRNAKKWYDQFADKKVWDKVQQAFLAKFKEDEASARAFTKISRLRMKKYGSVRKYADKLLDLVDKYNPTTSKSTVHDWFINGLPKNIGVYVRREGGTSLDEAQEAAQKYVDAKVAHRKGRKLKKKRSSKKKSKKSESSTTSEDDDDSTTSSSEEESKSTSSSSSSESSSKEEEVKRKKKQMAKPVIAIEQKLRT